MNKNAHTLGPWSIEGTTKHGTTILDDNGPVITTHMTPEVAALIAAAPDLLEALEWSIGVIKAELESKPMWAGNLPDSTARQQLMKARASIAKARGLR